MGNIMQLGSLPNILPAGTNLGATPVLAIPAGMGPPPWANYPGWGGPNIQATERPDLRINNITTPVVTPQEPQNRVKVFNGGAWYGPRQEPFGRRIRGYAIAGLGLALVRPWSGGASTSFTMGTRGGLGRLGALVPSSRVTLDELLDARPQDLDPCLNRVNVGTTSISYADIWQGYGTLLHLTGAVVSGVHGYQRNKSLGWGLAWGAFGFVAPLITLGVAVVQGLGKPK